jgi:hypothetical protein
MDQRTEIPRSDLQGAQRVPGRSNYLSLQAARSTRSKPYRESSMCRGAPFLFTVSIIFSRRRRTRPITAITLIVTPFAPLRRIEALRTVCGNDFAGIKIILDLTAFLERLRSDIRLLSRGADSWRKDGCKVFSASPRRINVRSDSRRKRK